VGPDDGRLAAQAAAEQAAAEAPRPPEFIKGKHPLSKSPFPNHDINDVWAVHASPDCSLGKLSTASGLCLCQMLVSISESRNEKHGIGLN